MIGYEDKRSFDSSDEGAASVPLKKRARLIRTSSQKSLAEEGENGQSRNMHAHFDCFSGAAGDMMLAACLDASEDPISLAARIVHAIKQGLPELANEFDLSHQKLWRGSGSIYAMSVSIQSFYNHISAPVPKKLSEDPKSEHVEKSDVNDDEMRNSHSHSHGHSHVHSEDHSHEHSHSRESSQTSSGSLNENLSHSHNHEHVGNKGPLRNLPEIRRLLEKASDEHIPHWVKNTAIDAFAELAKAEASVHGAKSIDAVHFHEVGAVDSIVDTLGSLLALYFLGAKTFSVSPLPMGEGTVRTAHGILPVPAPATSYLMVGMRTAPGPPGLTGELVTPTAAAILKVLMNNTTGVPTDRPPRFTLRRIGLGAGTKDFQGHPNIMRLFLGDNVLT